MEIREEYRPEIQRELTAHEQKLWTFRPSWSAPDVLAIREPSSEEKLYHHSQIDEEAENFYKLADANYFTKRYKKQIEKEQTWGFFLTDEGGVYVKPLERPLYWQAREFVKMFFIPNDPLWSFFKFESDNEAYTDLMRIIKDWITSAQSVIAINPRKKKLHGVALGCYNDGTYLSKKISQVQSFSAKVTELMNMRRFFQKKITSSMRFWNKNYYQIELLSVDDTFPEKQGQYELGISYRWNWFGELLEPFPEKQGQYELGISYWWKWFGELLEPFPEKQGQYELGISGTVPGNRVCDTRELSS